MNKILVLVDNSGLSLMQFFLDNQYINFNVTLFKIRFQGNLKN